MKLSEIIRKVVLAKADGAIDSYRVVRDREGYTTIYVSYDNEESIYFDEREWV